MCIKGLVLSFVSCLSLWYWLWCFNRTLKVRHLDWILFILITYLHKNLLALAWLNRFLSFWVLERQMFAISSFMQVFTIVALVITVYWSDFVTNSCGESLDSSCEKLLVPLPNQWVSVQKNKESKTENAWVFV